jgi:hypothetical protein
MNSTFDISDVQDNARTLGFCFWMPRFVNFTITIKNLHNFVAEKTASRLHQKIPTCSTVENVQKSKRDFSKSCFRKSVFSPKEHSQDGSEFRYKCDK